MARKYLLLMCLTYLAVISAGCDVPPTSDIQPEISSTPASQENQIDLEVRSVDGMPVVYIPGGTFQLGSTEAQVDEAIALCQEHYAFCNRWFYEREYPPHTVTLDGYWIDQTEISNAQYRLCVEAGMCEEPSTCAKGTPTYGDPGNDDHPVVCVSWEDAQAYCQWVGGRLPTEAEWEYAFRGEAGLIYPWGDEFDGSRLNYCDVNCSETHADTRFDDGYSLAAPVGSFNPSGASWAGVLNMGGNVSEWVANWLGDYSSEASLNPLGPLTGWEKVIKGCNWFFQPAYCRGATRGSVDPETRFDYIGFRCVVSEPQETMEEVNMTPNSPIIPSGSPPAIDGVHSLGEWDEAAVETFADGSRLFLMRGGDYLYLGIRANEDETIAANVFIYQGNEITIMHASAALGTAIYRRSGDVWRQAQNFTWRCRDTGSSDSALAERAEFLQEEGWLAANGLMGTPNELEYQIEITGEDLRVAAVYIKTTYPYAKVPWPGNLADDCVRSTPDGLPEELLFSPDQWITLTLSR